jgi:DAK2 domain fusion protein YloV
MQIENQCIIDAMGAAYEAVKARCEEINRLNVFPVPDGDTGTNVTLTMENVVKELGLLTSPVSTAQVLKAIKHGSLMGARGNSGVILSQVLRGITDSATGADDFDVELLSNAMQNAKEVAYHAVRKPVEGTILTVVKDTATAAERMFEKNLPLEDALAYIVEEAYASVNRTPDLMPKLKENGVVDSGGLAFAVLLEAFVGAILNRQGVVLSSGIDRGEASNQRSYENEARDFLQSQQSQQPQIGIEGNYDWDDHNYRYCTEFLFKSDTLDVTETENYLDSMGDCSLIVGDHPDFKVHVHTNDPGNVIQWMIDRGQPHEIHIHNMDMQSEEALLPKAALEAPPATSPETPPAAIGFVAVAQGDGNASILESFGIDSIVSGGQSMNPSTADLVAAVDSLNAETAIIFPNNKNIIFAANSACEVANKKCIVVPTTSIAQSFSAMFVFDPGLSLEENVAAMTEAAEHVGDGEVTTAVKNAVADDGVQITEGDVIGIARGKITVVGADVSKVSLDLLDDLIGEESETLTILAGEDFSESELESLGSAIEERFPQIEVDAQYGGQPLYPILLAVE